MKAIDIKVFKGILKKLLHRFSKIQVTMMFPRNGKIGREEITVVKDQELTNLNLCNRFLSLKITLIFENAHV